MKKKLIESFIGSVVILTAVVAITYWLGHYDVVTLSLVLLDILVVLFGAGLMTLIEYCLLKKKNNNN